MRLNCCATAQLVGSHVAQPAPSNNPCAGTAKQLAEEGIDPRSRLKFLPLAVSMVRGRSEAAIGCQTRPSQLL